MNKALQSKRKGSALALVLIAVVLLSVVGVGVLSLGMHSRVFAIGTTSGIAARCAMDAGLTKALFEMNQKLEVTPWDDSELPEATDEALPNCDATFSYTVTGDIDSGYAIESIGRCGRAEKRVICTLRLAGPFECAISTQDAVILKSNTLVSGYNSSDPEAAGAKVRVGTNSVVADSVILNPGVIVDGEVLVGVGGEVDTVIKDLGASVNGKYAIAEEIEFPIIMPPELPDMDSDIDVHGSTLAIGPGDSGKYGEIELKRATNPGILEVATGDVVLHVAGDIELGQDCEIKVKEGASLALYLDGDLDAHNNAGINNEGFPTDFKLFGRAEGEQKLDLKANSESFGAVYAPRAIITLMANGDVYGSVTGKSFEMKSGGNFYYDEALRDVSVSDEGVRFVIKHWQEQ